MLIDKHTVFDSIDFIEGTTILIDKPLNWTSFDVVNKLRYAIRHKIGVKKIKVGHAGTLDPLASGLLIICTGKSTKTIDTIQGQEKTYSGKIVLGATTATYDAEMEPNELFATDHIDLPLIETVRQQFIGQQMQMPPVYSALKINGNKAYDLVRRGKGVELEARLIKIYEFSISEIEMPNLTFEVKCSKGTYIRSLAYDFGNACGSGAYLGSLRREKIGDYSVNQALKLDEFIEKLSD